MADFIGFELKAKGDDKRQGVEYINLNAICRATYINPEEKRLGGKIHVELMNGQSYDLQGIAAEDLALAIVERLKNPTPKPPPK